MAHTCIKTIFGLLLFVSTTAQAQVQAQTCLTRPEFEGLMTFALPVVVDGLRAQCRASLPATSALNQSGALIAAKYQVDADKAWPEARRAFDKLSGVKLSGLLGQDAVRSLVKSGIGDGIARDIKPDDCPLIDRMVDVLQPLPTRNMAMLMSTLMELGDKKKAKTGPFKICSEKTEK